MKFRVLKNKSLGRNKKTGQAESIKVRNTIELSFEDIEQIDSLIRDLAIVPVDDTLVKNNARYRVLHSFKIEFEGETFTGKVGDEPQLGREVATHLMARGYIIPTNPEAWYPGQRDPQVTQLSESKKMYDEMDAATQKECGWVK